MILESIIQEKENIEKNVQQKKIESSNIDKNQYKNKKVLVVDDNKLNIKVATRLLEPYQAKVDTATSGQECIDKIKKNTYDLILLDQMMPEMDGTETLQHLKEMKDFSTPVVVITADAIVGKKEEYLSAGFDDYLTKPIVVEELNRILKKYLEK